MRAGARAIIIKDNMILLMHRLKNSHEYYVLPGGGIEENETPEQAVLREVKEETDLDIEIIKWWEIVEEYNKNRIYLFIAKSFKGNVRLGGPELEKVSENNKYALKWVPIETIKNLVLYPEEVKNRIYNELR